MGLEGKRVIGVHLRDGLVHRITSNDEEITDVPVVVFDDGEAGRALMTSYDSEGELSRNAHRALDTTRCHGIGIACDLAGEALIKLGRTRFDNPDAFINECVEVLERFHAMVGAAMRLESNSSDDE